MENDEKNMKNVENFAKNLEKDFSTFGEESEKKEKNNENNNFSESSEGWTIRSILDCFGVADFQALLALSDKKIYEIAIKNYPNEVRKACGTYTGINSAMANLRAKSIEKLMKKYSYNIDFVISDELMCGFATGMSIVSIFAQARFTANSIIDDLEILKKSKEVKE